MNIELHAAGVKLQPAQVLDFKQRLREALQGLAVLFVRVVLRLASAGPGPARRPAARESVVEVHLADGRVVDVSERQRHVGALLRRTVARAWSAMAPVRAGAGRDRRASSRHPRTGAEGRRV